MVNTGTKKQRLDLQQMKLCILKEPNFFHPNLKMPLALMYMDFFVSPSQHRLYGLAGCVIYVLMLTLFIFQMDHSKCKYVLL